jgi:hypothetical protein
VAAAAGRPWDSPLFYEEVNYAASHAFEGVSGVDHAIWDALRARDERDRTPADMGEDFDFNDEQEMRRRLPRLAALCLGGNATLCRTGSSEAAQRTPHRSPDNDPNRQAPVARRRALGARLIWPLAGVWGFRWMQVALGAGYQPADRSVIIMNRSIMALS